jgi:putative Mn2+ efflux pump MntP
MTALDAAPIIGLALALGLDSLRASVGLGALRPSVGHALWLAGAFAVFETAAPVIGMLLAGALAPVVGRLAEIAGPAVLAATGVCVTVGSLGGRETDVARVAQSRGFTLILPLSLSLDNLAAGAGLGFVGTGVLPAALVIGGMSGALALAGLRLGALISRVSPVRADVASGLLLVAAAAVLAMES